MNAPFTQDTRRGRLSTVLGPDALVLLRMDGEEELSGDFEWRVEALSGTGGVDLHALLGTHATVEIDVAGGTRAFDGLVTHAAHKGLAENGYRYDLTLRPWLHVATLRRNQRIFHDKTIPQIVTEVLSAYAELGDPHLVDQLTGDYPVLEYTVQYAESDADFIRRQLERAGITWHWDHNGGSHAMVLTDAMESHPMIPGGTRDYRGAEGHAFEDEQFDSWSTADRITTGAVRLTEYNFKTPKAAQEVDRIGGASHPKGDVESFDWPGDYLDAGAGRDIVAKRLDAERGQAPRHRATGDVASLGAGARVTLAGDEVEGATGRTFLALSATHRYRSQAYGTGDAQSDEVAYAGSWVLIPDDTPLVPERRTPAPRIQGPETAVVVGEGEIDCDEHGRILAHLHWDLEGAHTMRMRVSQNWASKGWGGMVIPRIGMEVIVEHLRGDPDKPIVTGCVYNGANRPPYELPKHKTRSTFRTDTHQGKGFNELRFEDEDAFEEIFIHAQKDMNERINNDHATEVGNNQSQWVGANRSVEVGKNQSTVVSGSMRVAVGVASGDLSTETALKKIALKFSSQSSPISRAVKGMVRSLKTLTGVGNLSILVNGNRIENTTKVALENVGISKSSIVLGTRNEITGSVSHIHVGSHRNEEVVGTHTQSAGKGWEASSGPSQIHLLPDGEIMITAPTLKLRAHKIDMEATEEIKMKAAKVRIN